jgi:hypothetical protein
MRVHPTDDIHRQVVVVSIPGSYFGGTRFESGLKQVIVSSNKIGCPQNDNGIDFGVLGGNVTWTCM